MMHLFHPCDQLCQNILQISDNGHVRMDIFIDLSSINIDMQDLCILCK